MRERWKFKKSVKFLTSLFKDVYNALIPFLWRFCPHLKFVLAGISQVKKCDRFVLKSVILMDPVISHRETQMTWTFPLTDKTSHDNGCWKQCEEYHTFRLCHSMAVCPLGNHLWQPFLNSDTEGERSILKWGID